MQPEISRQTPQQVAGAGMSADTRVGLSARDSMRAVHSGIPNGQCTGMKAM
jgi:hypothetical protein